tara:strand:- start:30 stop:791 length:762 start_codon:yes stop_codon:yes gene_type:complete
MSNKKEEKDDKFLTKNFQSFLDEFKSEFNCHPALWVQENIKIKQNRSSTKYEDPNLPYFLSFSLLKKPPQKYLDLYKEYFSNANNSKQRNPHQYVCNQVDGFMKEAFHIRKLSKLYPNFNISIKSEEFKNNIRFLYREGGQSRTPDLEITNPKTNQSVSLHVKSNAPFLNNLFHTFRGGKNPEFDLIKQKKSQAHILTDGTQYFKISDLINKEVFIKKTELLEGEMADSWGGKGARRIYFKDTIKDLAIPYNC